MASVQLLLGSNIEPKKFYLEKAIRYINSDLAPIKKYSAILETEPIGFLSNTHFLNQIIVIETHYSPISILDITQKIEKSIGRVNKSQNKNYRDRIIDIDILTYDNLVYKSVRLQIPHYENMEKRPFVKELLKQVNS